VLHLTLKWLYGSRAGQTRLEAKRGGVERWSQEAHEYEAVARGPDGWERLR
jgi:hypothetical protein